MKCNLCHRWSVASVGHKGNLEFTQDAEGLKVKMPADKPSEHVFAFKIIGLR